MRGRGDGRRERRERVGERERGAPSRDLISSEEGKGKQRMEAAAEGVMSARLSELMAQGVRAQDVAASLFDTDRQQLSKVGGN